MKNRLENLEGAKSLSKTEQKVINGGFVITNIRCQTKWDCVALSGDPSDTCYMGFCVIF